MKVFLPKSVNCIIQSRCCPLEAWSIFIMMSEVPLYMQQQRLPLYFFIHEKFSACVNCISETSRQALEAWSMTKLFIMRSRFHCTCSHKASFFIFLTWVYWCNVVLFCHFIFVISWRCWAWSIFCHWIYEWPICSLFGDPSHKSPSTSVKCRVLDPTDTSIDPLVLQAATSVALL